MQITSNVVRGIILGYRKSRAKQYCNQAMIKIFTDSNNIAKFIGARIIVRDNYGNIYRGKVAKVHSYENCIAIARFKPNIPGQVIGSYADVLFKT